MSVRWHALPDATAAAEACAHHVTNLLEEVLSGQEFVTFAVSGGSTPKVLFEKLATAKIRWDHTHLFWVDERMVPPTDPASNYKLAGDYLIKPAHIPQRHVHRIRGEMAPKAAAARYVEEIRDFFGLEEGEMPCFDVVHRGMGPDAHTASLFPGDPLIDDRERIAAAVFAPQVQPMACDAAAGRAAGGQTQRVPGDGLGQGGSRTRGIQGRIRSEAVSGADRLAPRAWSDLVSG